MFCVKRHSDSLISRPQSSLAQEECEIMVGTQKHAHQCQGTHAGCRTLIWKTHLSAHVSSLPPNLATHHLLSMASWNPASPDICVHTRLWDSGCSGGSFYCHQLPNGEGNSHPLQCSCLENPMDRGAWWAICSPSGRKSQA